MIDISARAIAKSIHTPGDTVLGEDRDCCDDRERWEKRRDGAWGRRPAGDLDWHGDPRALGHEETALVVDRAVNIIL